MTTKTGIIANLAEVDKRLNLLKSDINKQYAWRVGNAFLLSAEESLSYHCDANSTFIATFQKKGMQTQGYYVCIANELTDSLMHYSHMLFSISEKTPDHYCVTIRNFDTTSAKEGILHAFVYEVVPRERFGIFLDPSINIINIAPGQVISGDCIASGRGETGANTGIIENITIVDNFYKGFPCFAAPQFSRKSLQERCNEFFVYDSSNRNSVLMAIHDFSTETFSDRTTGLKRFTIGDGTYGIKYAGTTSFTMPLFSQMFGKVQGFGNVYQGKHIVLAQAYSDNAEFSKVISFYYDGNNATIVNSTEQDIQGGYKVYVDAFEQVTL